MERIVLAYSGGLDTSVAIPWLAETYGAEVIAVTLDLGQGAQLDGVRERALQTGAVSAYVLDVREEFVQEFILPALQAGAIYEDRYPLATALGRPLIARKLVEIAHLERAGAIAHGCTGKGNDQVRFDVSVARARPGHQGRRAGARVGHDARRRDRRTRAAHGIPVPVTKKSPYSTDENLWGALDRVRRPRGPVAGAARGRVHCSPGRPRAAPTSPPTSRSRSSTACRSPSTASRCRSPS